MEKEQPTKKLKIKLSDMLIIHAVSIKSRQKLLGVEGCMCISSLCSHIVFSCLC